jgi:DNA primase
MIPDEIIEQVRESADLVGLIGETVQLKRTGSDYRGPCPFHGGTHRNFAVIPKKGRYYCFVCKESGDVFSYLMKRFGMDYPTAVRDVAGRMGIVIPEQTGRTGPDPREPLFSAASAAHDWFARQLRESPEAEEARKYLKSRGLTLETAEQLQLGFAPRNNALLAAMAQLGIQEPILLEAGLLVRRDDGTVLPRFRGRLLFPIHDLRGRVVGFGGRLLGPGEPKYLNSPETPIFKKGGLLYNLAEARQAIRKEDGVVIVEGYFDVLRLVLAGMENVVAPMGTALTPDQAALLRRYTAQATLLLDSDQAGLRAAFRAGDELLRHEMRVKVASLPPGEDPDTLVQKQGLPALGQILHDAIDVMERKILLLERKGWFSGIEHQRSALDRLLPTIRSAKDPITRELYLTLVANKAGVSKSVLEQEVNALPAPPTGPPEMPEPTGSTPAVVARRTSPGPERQLMKLMIFSSDIRQRARELVREEWLQSSLGRELFEAMGRAGLDAPATPPDGLGDRAAMAWLELLAEPPKLTAGQQDTEFAGLIDQLHARTFRRTLEGLTERIRGGEAPAELVAEKRRIMQEFRDRLPAEYERWFNHQGLSVRGRGRGVQSRRGPSARGAATPTPEPGPSHAS